MSKGFARYTQLNIQTELFSFRVGLCIHGTREEMILSASGYCIDGEMLNFFLSSTETKSATFKYWTYVVRIEKEEPKD